MLGKLILGGAVGVAALGVVADLVVKGIAEDKIAERAEAAAGGQARASADIDSFPFLFRLLSSGSAGDVSVRVEDLTAASLRFATVTLDLEGVDLDRSKLLRERKGEVNDIDSGTLTLALDGAAVSRALGGLPVTIRDGRVEVQVAGRVSVAEVSAAGAGALRVRVPGVRAITIAVPRTDLLSCQASTAEVEDDEIRLGCTLTEVPPALLRAAQ